jgi:hypothetical protein
MKKLFIAGLFLFSVVAVSAQTRITKKGIIGKWITVAVEMKDVLYYNAQKDSVSFGPNMRDQVKDEQQRTAMMAMVKPQLAMLAKTYFSFNANGTAELGTGIEPALKTKYVVDEVNSTITTVAANKKEDALKAEMLGDKLRISIKQPTGDMMLLLKKAN